MSLNNTLWSLRKKILLSMVMLLLLLGLTTALTTRAILLNVLKTEFKHKGLSLARSLTANSVVDILTQNTSRLKKLLENEKSLDTSIAYIFITDSSGRILAHTFNKGFPVDLARANSIKRTGDFNIQTLDTQSGFIYDIAAPIGSEKSLLGQVRLGILQNSIQKTIHIINLLFIGITIFIMAIGIFLAYRVSALITKPISKLVQAIQSLQKGDFSTRIDVKANDEIGLLASAFNEMAAHLNLMVEEIKQLTTIKERDRIALDLHDGRAQDLANIIKRIELCEKLFKVEPARALDELHTLRENTKDILNRTRQVIFDLKSPQDIDFNLLKEIDRYIKDYQRTNNIAVTLDISSAINDIPPTKAKPFFYIITEALTNIKKHAQAKNVVLSLKANGNNEVMINIKDDGEGFDINNTKLNDRACEKFGLTGMRQRANSLGATLVINSEPQQGTEVSINIPLAVPDAQVVNKRD